MKLLVIEDDPDIREFVEIAIKLGFPGCQIITSHLGKEGIIITKKENPDVVLLDLGLPEIDGFEVLKRIRMFSQVPVIIETVKNSEVDIVRALTLGADDYIDKPFGQLELLARIKTVLKRTANEGTTSLSLGEVHFDLSRHLIICRKYSARLTPTESIIIEALLRSATKTQSFDKLAQALWNNTYPGLNDTIRVYVHRLKTKLESISQNSVTIAYTRGIGFTLKSLE